MRSTLFWIQVSMNVDTSMLSASLKSLSSEDIKIALIGSVSGGGSVMLSNNLLIAGRLDSGVLPETFLSS